MSAETAQRQLETERGRPLHQAAEYAAIAATDDARKEAMESELGVLRQEVQSTWRQLETSAKDVAGFCLEVDRLAVATPAIIDHYRKHMKLLEERQFVVERLGERQKLAKRLSELTGAQRDGDHMFEATPHGLMEEEAERGNTARELIQFDAQLIREISAFESRNGPFIHKGHRYLPVLNETAEELVTWARRAGYVGGHAASPTHARPTET
jgi:hypothetical protein